MEGLKNAVFTACLCAVLICAVRMCSPEKMKKELKAICGLVLIICAASSFTDGRIKITAESADFAGDKEYGELTEAFRESALEETKKSVESRLLSALEEEEINVRDVCIVCTFDEYNCVEVTSAEIYLSSEDFSADEAEKAADIISSMLPETEIGVMISDAEGS